MTRFTVGLPAAPRDAFDYLADPRHRPHWQSSLRAVQLLDEGPPRVGMRWVDRTAVGARPRLEIVEMTPPGTDRGVGTWTEAGTWHGLRVRLRLVFTPVLDRTRTRLEVHLRLESTRGWLPLRLVLHVLAPWAVRHDLRRAGRILRQRATRPGEARPPGGRG